MTVHHDYAVSLTWSDPQGTGSFGCYTRDHMATSPGKTHPIEVSAPEWFRGDRRRYNPGDLFLAALASGHMVRFLEIASQVGLVVTEYTDDALGSAFLGARGDGIMGAISLRPRITVIEGPHANEAEVARLHERAGTMSVIRCSVAMEVTIEPGELTVVPAPEPPEPDDAVARTGSLPAVMLAASASAPDDA